jgi:hypothetical protein
MAQFRQESRAGYSILQQLITVGIVWYTQERFDHIETLACLRGAAGQPIPCWGE